MSDEDYFFDDEVYDQRQTTDEEQQYKEDCAERARDMMKEVNHAN